MVLAPRCRKLVLNANLQMSYWFRAFFNLTKMSPWSGKPVMDMYFWQSSDISIVISLSFDAL